MEEDREFRGLPLRKSPGKASVVDAVVCLPDALHPSGPRLLWLHLLGFLEADFSQLSVLSFSWRELLALGHASSLRAVHIQWLVDTHVCVWVCVLGGRVEGTELQTPYSSPKFSWNWFIPFTKKDNLILLISDKLLFLISSDLSRMNRLHYKVNVKKPQTKCRQ